MILSGDPIKAPEALRIGLANRVYPPEELLERTLATAESAGAKGPVAVALAKRVIQQGQDSDIRTAHSLEQSGFGLVFGSRDHEEGMDAFLEKRDPSFKGD